jgi:NAD(P)-dependent dehydrogenase (short-subunit alcohol dehydrogenase family)
LTELLVPVLGDQSRVIFLSSAAHSLTKSLDLKSACIFDEGAIGTPARFQSYAKAKLCLLLYSKTFAQRHKGKLLHYCNIYLE